MAPAAAVAQEVLDPEIPEILPLRERAALRDEWLEERLRVIVPALMRRHGVDMWVLVAREYNEDPVLMTMLPATWRSARRRTILLFFDPGEDRLLEMLAVGRYPVGPSFTAAWSPEEEPDQWARLAELIAKRDPGKIALNTSDVFALADGMSRSQYRALREALPENLRRRIVADDGLAMGWLEARIPAEVEIYPSIVRIAHAIIAEGLSERVITPGTTSAEDVTWWYRERVRGLSLGAWFHPTVSIQRQNGGDQAMIELFAAGNDDVIRPGDLIHVDFGITYLGLNTDTQHHAYVLKSGERDAPKGLKAGLAAANRAQDILLAEFRAGDSGNAVLARALARTAEAGIEATIYSHPIGFHGHGAGPAIGLWDRQDGVPGLGDYPLSPNTAWAVELNVLHPVPEWGGQKVRFMLEEDAFFDGRKVSFLDGRQTEFHLIPRP